MHMYLELHSYSVTEVIDKNIIIIIIIIIFNPRKNEGGKKIKKSRKRSEVEN